MASFVLMLALSDAPALVSDANSSVTVAPTAVAEAVTADPSPAPDPATDTIAPQNSQSAKDAKKEAKAEKKAAKAQEEAPGFHFVWKDHPSVRAGKWLKLDFALKIQEDKMYPGDDPVDFDDLILKRARAGIDGELFKVFQFSVEYEFTKPSSTTTKESYKTQWRDVWGELNLADAFQFRGGRFKIPFSLDQLDHEASNDFVYKSLGADYLAPGRDTGGMAHGRFFDRGLNYSVGVFEHDGDNSQSKKIVGGDLTFAARVTGTPFRKLKAMNLDGTEIGASFASTEVTDESTLPNGLRGRTVMSEYTFFEPVFANGTRRRYGTDIDWTKRQFGARAEAMLVTDQRINQGLRGDTVPDGKYHAWYVSGGWVLTGEKSEKAIRPKRPVFRGGPGAIQIAARYDRLWFNSEDTGEPPFTNPRAEVILPSGDKVFTVGVNWYLNRWGKLQLNGIHEEMEDSGRTPLVDGGTTFWSTVLRFQLAL